MPSKKCQSCEHFGRYEWYDRNSNQMIAENRDRGWVGCKMKMKPSICGIEEENVKVVV